MKKTINGRDFELTNEQAALIDSLREDAMGDGNEDAFTQEDLEAAYATGVEDALDEVLDDEDEDEFHGDSADWQQRATTAEARLAVLTSFMHKDAAEEEGDDDGEEFEYLEEDELEELIEQEVVDRIDSILDAYSDAQDFLGPDYRITGQSTPHSIRCDALRFTTPRLDSNGSQMDWDSVEGVSAAYEAMKLYRPVRRDSRYSSSLERVFDRHADASCGDDSAEDMPEGRTVRTKIRKRKPDYTTTP